MDELICVLEKTISSDQNELFFAKEYLERAVQTDFLRFILELSRVLKNDQCSPVARMQAGLQLKNTIYSKDSQVKTDYQVRWLALPVEQRNIIKLNCIESLGTEQTNHSTAAQCVAYIACAELPVNQWQDLMGRLVLNVIGEQSTVTLKQSTLEAIGYICQDIDPNILANQSNEILTAIINGMKKDEPSEPVRLAATVALQNSLEFIKRNFDNVNERNFIMQVVCEGTQSLNTQIRVAALQCLVKITSLYYAYMEQYMGQALFAISLEAMNSDVSEVALQGIEFWSSICDEEIYLVMEAEEAAEKGTTAEVHSRYYAKGALKYTLPILMKRLASKDEHDDDDEWTPSKSAGVCLMLLAQCCRNDIVEEVKPFIAEHINNPNWQLRDAACFAFGAILEGPSAETILPLVNSALPILITLLRDMSSVAVRDTAAWTIGRIFELHPQTIVPDTLLRDLVAGLMEGLANEPRVATNVCWTITSLAESTYKVAKGITDGDIEDDKTGEPDTYALSPFFNDLVSRLLSCSDREDGQQHNLRNAAYSALMDLMKHSARDCYVAVQQTTIVVLERLKTVLQLMEQQQVSGHDQAQMNELQSLLCGALQSVLRRIQPQDAMQIADVVMEALLRMLSTIMSVKATQVSKVKPLGGDNVNADEKSTSGVQEDALLAVSALVDSVGGEYFMKYMDALVPHLESCLRNYSEIQVCNNAVGLLSDICRNLNYQVAPFAEQFLEILMHLLTNSETDKSLKPTIISVFGDFAMALGPNFLKYLNVVLNTLKQATEAQVDTTDLDMVEYLHELRQACLDTYSYIIQGLRSEANGPIDVNALAIVQPSVPYIILFLNTVASEQSTDDIVASACGLIGDLVTTFGVDIIPAMEQDSIIQLLALGRRSKLSKARSLAVWATKEIKKLKNLQQGIGVTPVNPSLAANVPSSTQGDMQHVA